MRRGQDGPFEAQMRVGLGQAENEVLNLSTV